MPIADNEVEGFVCGHHKAMNEKRPFWANIDCMIGNEWWDKATGLAAEMREGFRFLVEVNSLGPFVSAHVNNLFLRAPSVTAKVPAVRQRRPGRKKSPSNTPELIGRLADDWLARVDVKLNVTYAYQLALTNGMAGFKLGTQKGNPRDPLSSVWLDVLPRWEMLLDDHVRNKRQMTYIGHLRWELKKRAEELVGAQLDEFELEALPDEFEGRGSKRAKNWARDRQHARKYIQLLEFYDFEDPEDVQQRFYVVQGTDQNAELTPVGEPLPAPYRMPDGHIAAPIVPVVLANVPRYPFRGIEAAGRVYHHAVENNVMMTIAANEMRRDAARSTGYKKGAGLEELLEGIKSGVDGGWYPIDPPEDGTLEGLWKAVELPEFAQSLPLYRKFLEEARKDAQGFSDLLSGRQLNYASATEAEIVAESGEATATEIGSRMGESVSRMVEVFLVMLAELEGNLEMEVGKEVVGLDREELTRPWVCTLSDGGGTPVRDARKKQELTNNSAPYLELVKIATQDGKTPGPDGAPLPALPAPLRLAAQHMIDMYVTLYQWPTELMWDSLAAQSDDEPEEQGSGDPDKDAEIAALLDELLPQVLGQLQPPTPQGPQGETPPPVAPPVPGVV